MIDDKREKMEKIISTYEQFYEGYEEKSVDQIFNDKSSGLWRPETDTFLDFLTLKSLFYTEDWVYILVDRIASKISSQYMRVMKDEVIGGKKVARPAEGHPVQALIDNPNDVQDYHTFMYTMVADDCLLGNTFLWFPKSLTQMIPLPGENVRPFIDGKGNLTGYQIQQFDKEQGMVPTKFNLSLEEICHIRRPNPSSMWVGLSPFIPAQKSLLFSRYSAEYLNNFYIKGAQPGLVLEMGSEANQEMATRLLRSMENAYTGRRNQRRNMVLPKGVKASQINVSMADQQLIDLVNQNREKIINILQVPKHELSIAESGSLGSEEYKTAIKNFWRGPLRSTMRRIAGALTLKLKPKLGEGYYLDFDLSDIEYLSEDESNKAATAAQMLSVHTLNEVRAKVYDLPPLPGGDRVPGAMVPVFNEPIAQETPIAQEAPVVQEVPEIDTKGITRAAAFTKAKGGDWWTARQEAEGKVEASAEDDMALLAQALLIGIGKKAAGVLTKNEKRFVTKDEDKRALKRKIAKAIQDLQDDYVAGLTDVLSATVEMGYNTSLMLPFDLPDTDAITALRDRNAAKRLSMLEARGLDSFANISRSSTEGIVDIIAGGLENNKTLQEIAAEIEQRYSKTDAASRALTIARTEALTAKSLGQQAAMKDAEKVTGETFYKMWLNAGDDRVRGNPGGLYPNAKHDHWTLQGEVIKSNEKFKNGLMFPRDPSGDAGDVINCRCSLIILPESELDTLNQWSDEFKE
jgi:HK97 family phage portal protein